MDQKLPCASAQQRRYQDEEKLRSSALRTSLPRRISRIEGGLGTFGSSFRPPSVSSLHGAFPFSILPWSLCLAALVDSGQGMSRLTDEQTPQYGKTAMRSRKKKLSAHHFLKEGRHAAYVFCGEISRDVKPIAIMEHGRMVEQANDKVSAVIMVHRVFVRFMK
jgi:hypothetical protein